VTYTVRNAGGSQLVLDPQMLIQNTSNMSNLVPELDDLVLHPNEETTLTLYYTVDATGAAAAEFVISGNAANSPYTLVVNATGQSNNVPFFGDITADAIDFDVEDNTGTGGGLVANGTVDVDDSLAFTIPVTDPDAGDQVRITIVRNATEDDTLSLSEAGFTGFPVIARSLGGNTGTVTVGGTARQIGNTSLRITASDGNRTTTYVVNVRITSPNIDGDSSGCGYKPGATSAAWTLGLLMVLGLVALTRRRLG